jgi:ribonuclease HII
MKYLIGIDEVGRGPLAGPVAVGSLVFLKPEARKFFRGVRESKQLTEEKREEWFLKIEEAQQKGIINFRVIFQSEKVIDKKGISFAIKKCLEQSLKNLNLDCDDCVVLLDGGLKAPIEYKNQKTIIKGDAKEQVIALASICAKVLRDRKMRKLAKKYPLYGFDVHKGYGTRSHREAIRKYGILALHRVSFCKNLSIDIGR